MANRILHAELIDRSTVPSEAEVYLTVLPAESNGAEVRARLMGPRCMHASTVEVAYHFRPVLVPTSPPAVTLRAIIPEASPWSPEAPHLYHGVVELWQGGQRVDSRALRLGLRDFRAGPRGLRCNGRVITLNGVDITSLDEAAATRLRGAGVNLLLCPVSEETRPIWELASRVGFAVIGRIDADTPGALLHELAHEPSALGWLESGQDAAPPPHGTLLGVPAGHPALASAHFVAATAGAEIPAGKPVLLIGERDIENPLLGRVT
jgi:hypothetical protein